MQTWLGPGRRAVVLLALAVAGLAGGLWARLAGAHQLGDRVLTLTVAAGLVPLAVSVPRPGAAGARRGCDRAAGHGRRPGAG